MTAFRRLAIADRAGPAIRCLAAVADLNSQSGNTITTIALYCEADTAAWFVRAADHAEPLGVDTPNDITVEAVLHALEVAHADAVWVGWNPLVPAAELAPRCEAAGIVVIGADFTSLRRVGDDVVAKRLADSLAIMTVPWAECDAAVPDTALAAADDLGYPVLVRSVQPGPPIQRLVTGADLLPDTLRSVAEEAARVGASSRVILERWVRRARQVEVQVVGDRHGTVWALGVRDSSIQRGGEKVLQESRCTAITDATAEQLRLDATRFAEAVHYVGAGTADFLVDLDTGDVLFRTFHARLQAGHAVTEATTGVDLVRLTLQVAAGEPLEGTAPSEHGHAVGVRLLASDPERGFAPAGGRLTFLRLPVGAGVRVDTGYTEGDVVDANADPLIATIVATGLDRDETLARLNRALRQLIVVIDGGTTTKALAVLDLQTTALREGSYDCGWLDGLVATHAHLPAPDPLALLVAAAHAYELEEDVVREQFLQSAARWRPTLPTDVGHRVDLRLRGQTYRTRVFRTGPDAYRVDTGHGVFDLTMHRLSKFERAVASGGRRHRVVLAGEHGRFHVEVDGVPHVVLRDDGVVVHAPSPAFVVDLAVRPEQRVTAGDRLVVLESMKMLMPVVAPVDGTIATVSVAVRTQVDVGMPLLRIRQDMPLSSAVEPTVFDSLTPASEAPDDVYATARAYLLGYDVDDVTASRIQALMREVSARRAVADADELADEVDLIEIFSDVCALSRREPDADEDELAPASPQEHLFTYLSRLDSRQAGVPMTFIDRLSAALARYGVCSLDRSSELERALVLMYRSFLRSREASGAVVVVLERWLHEHARLIGLFSDRHRAALSRLAHVSPGRADVVADLVREVHYRYVDEPLLQQAQASADARIDEALKALADQDGASAATLVDELVAVPRPLRTKLRDAYASAEGPVRDRLLEVRLRRFYRSRELHDVHCVDVGADRACMATLFEAGAKVRISSGYCRFADLGGFVASCEQVAGSAAKDASVVIDVETWRDGPTSTTDDIATDARDLLRGIGASQQLARIELTVTTEGVEPEHLRTHHVAFRWDNGEWHEDEGARDMHPMLAERIELWRWSQFNLVRLASAEDVYAFTATARANTADVRLVAMAEVRDLTPARDSTGQVTGYPLLERIFCEALTTFRHTLAGRPVRTRPAGNRIVLYVRPTWVIPADTWRWLVHRMGPMSNGLGLEKVQVRVRLPDPATGAEHDAVLEVGGAAERGVTMRVRPPSDRPVRPLTSYRQRVLKAERAGAPYPYELIRNLTPPPVATSDFPPGSFVEYDVDESSGRLVPIDRPPGENTCGIVTGVLTSFVPTMPEGMARVVLLGDPTRGLGNLAEAECRRIVAALDLAERMRVPVEWFALSSGARIAMDSGTENMDWIAAVLRRLIEFTQAGGEVNVVVTGINVGAQPYWNAEATMLMHTRGILVMTPSSAMVLTGKSSLDYSGGVSAEDNTGIGGFERVMGPNGQGQYWAPTLADACALLLQHYDYTYVAPGESRPRRVRTTDPADRDVRDYPHRRIDDSDFDVVGDVFSSVKNPERKKPFDMRSVMRAVADADCRPLERWGRWRDGETAIVWDARIGGIAVCMLGIESRTLSRSRFVPTDGPPVWTSGTLFPQSSRKLARAINSASGNRPVVVLANLSGFDGSPESMRKWQLEYGAEIGRAVTNFDGPIVFVVVSRYHGGAFVVFSKRLNERMEIAAVEGSYASVIGGAPAAAVVFSREVTARTEQDPRVVTARQRLTDTAGEDHAALRQEVAALLESVRTEKLKEVADEFDHVHDIRRAQRVGSVDLIVPARELRPYIVAALERGLGVARPHAPQAQPVG